MSPSIAPTNAPSFAPSIALSFAPSIAPSFAPSIAPSFAPSIAPTNVPSAVPTLSPTTPPSNAPSVNPTISPTLAPTSSPTTCWEFETNRLFSDDGQNEESIAHKLSQLQFVNPVLNTSKLVHASSFYKQTVHYTHDDVQQLMCDEMISCLNTNIYFDDNAICNVRCSGSHSCVAANIFMTNCDAAHILCNGSNACSELYVEVESAAFIIECGVATSCNFIHINITGNNKKGNISCIDFGSCDGAQIFVDPANYQNVQLQMTSYSENVTFSNGFGYQDINQSVPYVDCNAREQYVRYNNTALPDNDVESLVLNEYKNGVFPCDGVTIICFEDNDTSQASECDIQFTAHSLTPNGSAPCYWVQIDNVLDISCTGSCVTSPTLDPTASPTVSPTETTIDPTRDPTIDPTIDPTLDPTIDPTIDPTMEPTNDPTRDPTLEPTINPTLDPTMDPTIDPTSDPTMDPTYIPTNDPTSDPTLDPTSDPTIDPTIDPTFDPTNDPTNIPTMDPTVDPTTDPTLDPTSDPTTNPTPDPSQAPTLGPSNAPSTPPTDAPSFSPSVAPSIAPSVAPTFSPSSIPTNAPTFSPSNAPTRTPTVDVDDRERGYDYYVDIEYAVHNLTAQNKKFIVSNQVQVMGQIEEILEANYFDEEVLKYNAFWLDIKEVNDVDIAHEDLSEYDLDILEIEGIPMTLHTRIETKEQLTGFIITKSSGDTFRQNTEWNFQSFFNNSALYFNVYSDEESELMANAKFTTQPPPEKEDPTALGLSIGIVSTGSIISAGAFIFNKMPNTKVDNAAFWAPLLISLNLFDFASDINLSYTIMQKVNFSTHGIYELIFWLGFGSIFFIILPFGCNLLYAMRIRRQTVIQSNPAARSYFTKMLPQFILMCVFCAGTYPVITLTSSRVFALQVFNAGLLPYELHQLSKIKIRSTIYLENCPQLLIQIVYAFYIKERETATILAFVASFLSVVASVIIYQAQKDVSDESFISKYFITLHTKDGTQQIDANEERNITEYRGLKERLRDRLSVSFGVSNKSIEIGYVTLNQHGCTIHIQHSIFKEDLETLRNKIFQNRKMDGYNIQITEDLYIKNLFDLSRGDIVLALVNHFHLDTVEKQFTVRYHKQIDQIQDSHTTTRAALDISKTTALTKRLATQQRLHLPHSMEIEMGPIMGATVQQVRELDDEKEEAVTKPIYSEFESKMMALMAQMVDALESQHNVSGNDDVNPTEN
eukprot:325541_1